MKRNKLEPVTLGVAGSPHPRGALSTGAAGVNQLPYGNPVISMIALGYLAIRPS